MLGFSSGADFWEAPGTEPFVHATIAQLVAVFGLCDRGVDERFSTQGASREFRSRGKSRHWHPVRSCATPTATKVLRRPPSSITHLYTFLVRLYASRCAAIARARAHAQCESTHLQKLRKRGDDGSAPPHSTSRQPKASFTTRTEQHRDTEHRARSRSGRRCTTERGSANRTRAGTSPITRNSRMMIDANCDDDAGVTLSGSAPVTGTADRLGHNVRRHDSRLDRNEPVCDAFNRAGPSPGRAARFSNRHTVPWKTEPSTSDSNQHDARTRGRPRRSRRRRSERPATVPPRRSTHTATLTQPKCQRCLRAQGVRARRLGSSARHLKNGTIADQTFRAPRFAA